MATLDNTDFRQIKKLIKAKGSTHLVFKNWGLSKENWKTLFQTAETWFVGGFLTTPTTSFKAALEASPVGAMTNAQAKEVGLVWMGWRYKINP